ncbi:protein MpRGI-like [Marchantia polymorpha subsp. ruderalis]|nr:hypothetical protein MARPO_0005s0124 [Marchantia polymorpha]BAF79945.1 receptor-like kinase [Marchantia polymorpha]BBM97323.1 hypothetical protein Mp_1g04830 [Marchantia polymorpha subsp. ruderalis]|eukprot:PTQ48483.1 hypothetical protein MARPO_0005s0124 [Marchantia polymorpha]
MEDSQVRGRCGQRRGLVRKFLFLQSLFMTAMVLCEAQRSASLAGDSQVLTEFRAAIVDDSVKGCLANWTDSVPVCSWYGVACSRVGGGGSEKSRQRVTGIQLGECGMTGVFSAAIAKLPYLETVELFSNNLSGTIPPELGSLSRLKAFVIGENRLTGEIPSSLTNCTRLERLGLAGNMLEGRLPAEISRLKHLAFLNLQFNFFNGSIPSEYGLLTNLSILLMQNNQLVGSIPASFGNLTSLTDLELDNNFLTGSLPPEIGKCSNLQILHVRNNSLTGSIPEELSNLAQLTSLDLMANNLSGILPAALGNLSLLTFFDASSNQLSGPLSLQPGHFPSLEYFYLSANRMSGTLPEALGSLPALRHIYADTNKFHGGVPDLGKCENLTDLILYGNMLNGSINPTIGQNKNLETFYAYENQLTGGIPPEIGHCTHLKNLDLDMNNLTGPIPPELGNLTLVVFLNFYKNFLTGPIPPEMGKMTMMENLTLSDNQLTGTIPPELGRIHSLKTLLLYQNRLEGSIPSTLSNCKNLSIVNFSGNKLSGVIAGFDQLSPCRLEVMDLSNNSLTGPIPPLWGGCQGLRRFRLHNNRLTGTIPATFANFTALELLDVSSNDLHGEIPVALLTGSPALGELDLSRNNLVGLIPSQIDQLGKLQVLDLSWNRLTGRIPPEIGNIPKLSDLRLNNNALGGVIPTEVGNLSALTGLKLQSNQLEGVIPAALSSCVNLIELRLGNNRLSGAIPAGLGSLYSLSVMLDLGSNSLTGSIPPAFQHLDKLERLNLSSNFLSGRVPAVLGSLVSLTELNISNNQLVGPLPESQVIERMNVSCFLGNTGLCGPPLAQCQVVLQPSEGLSGLEISMIVLAVVGFVMFVAGIALLCYRARQRDPVMIIPQGKRASSFNLKVRFNNRRRKMTFNEIMKATDNLHESNLIGKGGYGLVYKAVMPSGEILAVKKVVFHDDDSSIDKSFIREVETLGRIRHRHLLNLIGFCSYNGVSLLVYEYMANGSLADILYLDPTMLPHGIAQELRKKQQALDWGTRYDIAVAVAEGLAYLHHDCSPPIIHRDIKSSNILLDSDMIAHVGDFGLAKILEAGRLGESMSIIAGSYGYIAPEYSYTMRASEKSDVYSFGVVLLELITGRGPIDQSFPDGVDIVAWVRSCIIEKKQLDEVLDTRLATPLTATLLEILLVLKTALQCTSPVPAERPSMRDNVIKLIHAREGVLESASSPEAAALTGKVALANVLDAEWDCIPKSTASSPTP